mmetsp:Transcript_27508/g.87424  ORF Transcript_27508/g.87424 Transcript_27508/m.87424 type:complete len:577 (-) Transcript_27508:918-2648(-)
MVVPMYPQREHCRDPLDLDTTMLAQPSIGRGHVGAVGPALAVARAMHGPNARYPRQPPCKRGGVLALARELGVVAGDRHHGRGQLREELGEAQDAVGAAGVAKEVDAGRVHWQLRADLQQQADDELLHFTATGRPREVPGLVGRRVAGLEPVDLVPLGAGGEALGNGRGAAGAARCKADEAGRCARAAGLARGTLRSLLKGRPQPPRDGVAALVRGGGAMQVQDQGEPLLGRGGAWAERTGGLLRNCQDVWHCDGPAWRAMEQREMPWHPMHGPACCFLGHTSQVEVPHLAWRPACGSNGPGASRERPSSRQAASGLLRVLPLRGRPQEMLQQCLAPKAIVEALAAPVARRPEFVEPSHAVERLSPKIWHRGISLAQVEPSVAHLQEQCRRQDELDLTQAPRALPMEAGLREIDATDSVSQLTRCQLPSHIPQLKAVCGKGDGLVPGVAAFEEPPLQPPLTPAEPVLAMLANAIQHHGFIGGVDGHGVVLGALPHLPGDVHLVEVKHRSSELQARHQDLDQEVAAQSHLAANGPEALIHEFAEKVRVVVQGPNLLSRARNDGPRKVHRAVPLGIDI